MNEVDDDSKLSQPLILRSRSGRSYISDQVYPPQEKKKMTVMMAIHVYLMRMTMVMVIHIFIMIVNIDNAL